MAIGFGFNRGFRNDNRRPPKEDVGKLYSIIRAVAVAGLFIALALVIMTITHAITLTSTITGILISIAIVCFCALSALPWIRRIEKKENILVSWIFIGLIALSALLWVIATWIAIGGIYNQLRDDTSTAKGLATSVTAIKIIAIVSLQFVVASIIGSGIMKYQKSMIVFQVIIYLSYLFYDFYLTYAMCCLSFDKDYSLVFNESAIALLTNKIMYTIFIISLIYILIANMVMNKMEARRYQEAIIDSSLENTDKQKSTSAEPQDAEERLTKLKKMLDDGLITKEEFEEKKKEILKDM